MYPAPPVMTMSGLRTIYPSLSFHRAARVAQFLQQHHLLAALLPPYAPELNPVEIFWAYLKGNPLANLAAVAPPA